MLAFSGNQIDQHGDIIFQGSTMRSLLFASLVCLAALSAVAQKASSPIKFEELVTYSRISYGKPAITAQRPAGPVIRGAGTIEFDINPADFPVELINEEYGTSWMYLELGFDGTGNMTHCERMSPGYGGYVTKPAPDEEHLCKMARSKMRFRYDPQYRLDAPTGYLAVNVGWTKRLFPAKPYRLSRTAKGVEVGGSIEKGQAGKSKGCEIWTEGLSPKETTEVCAMLSNSPSFNTQLATFAKKARGDTKRFTVWLEAATPAPRSESDVEVAETRYDVSPDAYQYPSAIPKDVPMMPDGIGQLFLEFDPAERPDKHLAGWEQAKGITTLALEIGPDGSVLSCKPYKSSDNAGLDLKACELAKLRGRFVFTSGIRIDKPHFYRAWIGWPDPNY